MNRRELSAKIIKAVNSNIYERGYVSAIDVLFYLNKLTRDFKFSKLGNPRIEEAYSTHYITTKRE